MTKDEQFLLCCYEMEATEENPLNRYVIGKAIGINTPVVDGMCQHLVRTNFIRKDGEEDIYLTSHGAALAKQVQGEVRELRTHYKRPG